MSSRPKLGVPIRFWNHMRNFGDSINPYVVKQVSGLEPYFCNDSEADHLVAIGSILFMSTRKSHIWGTGAMNTTQKLGVINPQQVYALRGKLTLSFLQNKFPEIKSVPLGDPGIFVDEIPEVQEMIKVSTEDDTILVVPNHRFQYNNYFRLLAQNEGVVVLDPTSDRVELIRAIIRAKVVVSQSLHGLIFAEVFQKPAVWISHTANADWNFKFLDWFSTTVSPLTPLPFGTPLNVLKRGARIAGLSVQRDRLRSAFPRIEPKILTTSINFEESRRRSPFVFDVQQGNYRTPAYACDGVIMLSSRSNSSIKSYIDSYQTKVDELFSFILVFDKDIYLSMSNEILIELQAILDNNHDINSIQLLPDHLRRGTLVPNASLPPKSKLDVEEWQEHDEHKGIVLVRNVQYFRPGRDSIAAFVKLSRSPNEG